MNMHNKMNVALCEEVVCGGRGEAGVGKPASFFLYV